MAALNLKLTMRITGAGVLREYGSISEVLDCHMGQNVEHPMWTG